MADPNKPLSGANPSQPNKPGGQPAAPRHALYEKTRADTGLSKAPSEVAGHSAPSKLPQGKNLYGATQADAVPSQSTEGGRGAGRPVREVYEVVHLIAEGGMGSVFLARDIQLRRWVALKRMSKEFVGNPRMLERFRVEGRAVAALNHFHIVSIFAMAEDREGPYIVMEYVAGQHKGQVAAWPIGHDIPAPPLNLEGLVKRSGPLKVDPALALLRKLCSAVEYAHQRKVIHRDIKPANVLLDEQGEPKLTDFGLARQMDGNRQDRTTMGASVGSRGYMAPEQEINAAAVDHRADLYALGGTLWFMLTGQNPAYFRESEAPAALRPVLIKALEKDREKRFKSAAEFELALGRPGAASSARSVAAGIAVPGSCAKCGHVHFIDPQKGFTRTICEMCGANLVDPCLKCGTANGVWAKFCNCGADLAATLQAVQKQCVAEPAFIRTLRHEARFAEAIERLKKWSAHTHSALKQFVEWARAECKVTEGALGQALLDAQARQKRADQLIAAYDDADAVRTLEGIPAPLRSGEALARLQKASDRLAQVADLSQQIQGKLSTGQYDGLLDLTCQFLHLRPNHADMMKVQECARRYEVKQEEACWQAALKQDNAKGYQRYLHAYPRGVHGTEALEKYAYCLRQRLLEYPTEVLLRREYLGQRSKQLLEADRQRALHLVAANYALYSSACGFVFGVVYGSCNPLMGFIAGILAATIVGGFLTKQKTLAIYCLIIGVFACIPAFQFIVNALWAFASAILGALSAAGMGAIIGLIKGKHEEKSRALGPLPWYAYPLDLKALRDSYLGRD